MKPAPTTTGLQMTGGAGEVQAAWMSWVDMVSDEERLFIAETLSKHELDSVPSINAFAKDILIGIFAGRLSPTVAAAAKPWMDMICMNVHIAHQATATDPTEDIIRAAIEIRRSAPKLIPSYTTPMVEASPELVHINDDNDDNDD